MDDCCVFRIILHSVPVSSTALSGHSLSLLLGGVPVNTDNPMNLKVSQWWPTYVSHKRVGHHM